MSIAALETKVTPYFDWADVLGRIALALLFLWSGYTKLASDQVLDQQTDFMKNVAIIGGLLFVFARGPSRFAIERS